MTPAPMTKRDMFSRIQRGPTAERRNRAFTSWTPKKSQTRQTRSDGELSATICGFVCISAPGQILFQRAAHSYHALRPCFFAEAVSRVDLDGPLIIFLDFQEDGFQIQGVLTELK